MWQRALSGGGGGGSTISKESGMLTANVPIRIKATNCLFLLFDYRNSPNAWSNSAANTTAWCGVHEKDFVHYTTVGTVTLTYDTTTEIMTITTTDYRWTSYLIFGDYEVLT